MFLTNLSKEEVERLVGNTENKMLCIIFLCYQCMYLFSFPSPLSNLMY